MTGGVRPAKNAGKYLADEKVRTHSALVLGRKVKVTYRPLGVVGVIAPWSYPLTLGFGDALPARMAGNSVIIKPSEITGAGQRAQGCPSDFVAAQVTRSGSMRNSCLACAGDRRRSSARGRRCASMAPRTVACSRRPKCRRISSNSTPSIRCATSGSAIIRKTADSQARRIVRRVPGATGAVNSGMRSR